MQRVNVFHCFVFSEQAFLCIFSHERIQMCLLLLFSGDFSKFSVFIVSLAFVFLFPVRAWLLLGLNLKSQWDFNRNLAFYPSLFPWVSFSRDVTGSFCSGF